MRTRNIVIGVIIAFLIFKFFIQNKSSNNGKRWTVYGTSSCGWTRKQLVHMKEKGIPHEYIDCDKNNCGDIKAFPTMKDPNGKVITGYSLVH